MLQEILSRYLDIYPDEADTLKMFAERLAAADEMNNRKTFPGHVTGSGIVLSPDRTKILLVHHRFLQRWLQPGGHWEADETDPLEAARREVIEETGVRLAEVLPLDTESPLLPFDIEIQDIPDRPERDEPKHNHYDFRYIFVAKDEAIGVTEHQILDAGWFDFDAPEGVGIQRIITKLRDRGIIQA